MIALDTNLLARLLLKDDAGQYSRVVALLESDNTFTAPLAVFLELVWVLEANACTSQEMEAGLNLLLGLSNVKTPHLVALRAALAAYSKGMYFADTLHLTLSSGEVALETFDKALVRRAKALGLTPTVALT